MYYENAYEMANTAFDAGVGATNYYPGAGSNLWIRNSDKC